MAMQSYQHLGSALLRAAVRRDDDLPICWPDPSDDRACAAWLKQVWADEQFAQMIGQASPVLAAAVANICRGDDVPVKRVRGAALSVARYLLRAAGRPTPFGLFAGVTPVQAGRRAGVRWGGDHRVAARPDTEWLAGVVERLEADACLLPHLKVVFSDLARVCGGWVEMPLATGTVRVRETAVVRAARDLAAGPVRFGELALLLADRFGSTQERAETMLAELVRQGLLITSLRAPFTITDPLDCMLQVLTDPGKASTLREVTRQLEVVRGRLQAYNVARPSVNADAAARHELERLMRPLSVRSRSALAVDLVLDCEISIPGRVMAEAARAANVLLRLARHRDGFPAWRAYHAVFCDRYGTGLAVPLAEVIHSGTGLGFPGGYPGSVFPEPAEHPGSRDQRLLSLAWDTVLNGTGELVLTDAMVDTVTSGWQPAAGQIPPHVEVAVRISAASLKAIDDGDYTLTVSPARAGGVLTSRFTATATGAGMEAVYRSLPTATAGALAAQLSFPPAYPHAENVSRVPAYLPWVLSLGEHRQPGAGQVLRVSDLAIVATAERLHLVTAEGRVVEPQVFHALNLDKQPPPLARFLAHIARAFTASWTAFDWGPSAAGLPYLPRVRHGHCILSPARWTLHRDDVPPSQSDWRGALEAWRSRMHCPQTAELRDDDRTLPLDLDKPMHAEILRRALTRHDDVTLAEPAGGTGWLGGHAHEIAIPLAAASPPAPAITPASSVLARHCGQLPGDSPPWLYAKLFVPAAWQDEVLTSHVPDLLAELGSGQRWWFVRYRSSQETDHLRLRLHTGDAGGFARCAEALGRWAARVRGAGLAGRMMLDTYYPETGRYGGATAMGAAEQVFAADSQAVIATLRTTRASPAARITAAAFGMIHIAAGLLGENQAIGWFAANPVRPGRPADPATIAAITAPGRDGHLLGPPVWADTGAAAIVGRTSALAAYQQALPHTTDFDAVLRSLLHMHHNRLAGIDPDGEQTCRYLARRACLSAQARAGA